jgi:HEAT repeat protein
VPYELQLSDSNWVDGVEEDCAKALAGNGKISRLIAAKALWYGHSRVHAAAVIKFVGEPPTEEKESFDAFKREVDDSLRPGAILRELQDGDYKWGAWLAFLRPHADLVPELLKALKEKKDHVRETSLALGKSRDDRALAPLVELLKTGDYFGAASAARALGYFGGPKVEQPLIEALAAGSAVRKMTACEALGRVGTRAAIPPLEKLAADKTYTGVINLRIAATQALEQIRSRHPDPRPEPGAK